MKADRFEIYDLRLSAFVGAPFLFYDLKRVLKATKPSSARSAAPE